MDALLDRIQGNITQEELESTCYSWAYYNALETLKYKQLPVKPSIVDEFEHMTESRRKRIYEEGGEIRTAIDKYGAKLAAVKHENQSCLMYLKKMEHFYKDKADRVAKIRESIITHEREGE